MSNNRLVVGLLAALLVVLGVLIGVLLSGRGAAPGTRSAAAPSAGAPSPPASAPSPTHEMFIDKDEHFVRAGTREGLTMGGSVIVHDESGAPVGSGSVVEIWDHLARVSLDSEAAKAEPPLRASTTAGPARPTDPGASNRLSGSASIAGIGPARRITVHNAGPVDWTGCDLRLPTNRRYRLERLRAGDQERIVLPKFAQDGVPRDLPLTWLSVTCSQGAARFALH